MGSLLSIVQQQNLTVEMGSTLLFLALCGMAVAHPQMRQHVTTISMSNLEAAVDSGRTAHIKRALHQVGALAVDGLSADYVRALESLRSSAPACLDGSLRVKLNDAVERFSHVQSNGEEAPKCVKADYDPSLPPSTRLRTKSPEPWPTSSETAPCSSRKEARSRSCPSWRPRLISTCTSTTRSEMPPSPTPSLSHSTRTTVSSSCSLPPTSFPLFSSTSRADPSSPIVSDLTPSCSWSAVASLTGFSRMLSTACSPLHTPSHPSPELPSPTGPSWPG